MDHNQHILITGATGFVGSYLLQYLLRKGYHNISALRRTNSPMEMVAPFARQVRWLEGDVLDVPFLEEAMQGIQQLYHCAALISTDSKDADLLQQVNTVGTSNVVNIALYRGVERMLHVSSIAAIGRLKNRQRVHEQSKWQRSPLNSNYGISKYQAEQEVWRGVAEGLQAVIINPGIVLGSGIWDRGTGQFFSRVAKGLRYFPIGGSGFVDVRDVARMCIQLMESDLQSQRFLAIGENHSYKAVFDMIADEMQKRRPSIRVSPWLGKIAWRAAAVAAALSGRPSSLTRQTVELTNRTYLYDNTRSRQQLHFEYTPIRQTIAESARQYLESTQKGENFAILPLNHI